VDEGRGAEARARVAHELVVAAVRVVVAAGHARRRRVDDLVAPRPAVVARPAVGRRGAAVEADPGSVGGLGADAVAGAVRAVAVGIAPDVDAIRVGPAREGLAPALALGEAADAVLRASRAEV